MKRTFTLAAAALLVDTTLATPIDMVARQGVRLLELLKIGFLSEYT
jgi:hypothetical protein